MKIENVKELDVYKMAFNLAMEIFQTSKTWPAEEKYSLTDQVRRSSRSACANLREAWAKRCYENHFISKLTDAENGESGTWLDFAHKCGYLALDDYRRLTKYNVRIGQMLGAIMLHPTGFIITP